MAKVVRTLRNNWKKSTFAAILGYYGINYGRNWHKDYLMMREFSAEALVHGKRPLPSGAKNKHITLFLNPTAGNRKSKSKLEKYAEPLLHLSGFLVNVVKTERIDEARDLAGVIEKTNIIAVAGGDGTLFETVTGLLRRDDIEEAIRRFPIGIIPLGHHNQFAKKLFKSQTDEPQPNFIAESTMAIIRHKIRPQDVMEITIAEQEDNKEAEAEQNVTKVKKPFYSLAGINIGQYREAQKLRNDMPSLFPEYFATFLSLYRAPEQLFKAEIRYVPSCEGCVKCVKPISTPTPAAVAVTTNHEVTQPSIWSKVFSVFQPAHVQAETSVVEIEESNEDAQIVNPNCGNWSSLCVETTELNIKPCGNGELQLEIGGRLGKTDFMIEGLKRFRKEPSTFSQQISCTEIEILPVEGQEFLSIDNEEFDMKPIKVRCLKDKVYFFSP